MNKNAERSVDRERNTIDHTMCDLDGMDSERSQGEALTGLDLVHLGVIEQAVLFEFAFDKSEGEFRPVDGNVEFGEDPGQSADVVFVAVSQDYAADLVAVLEQIGDVGYDDVHAEQLGFREHEASVDDDDVISPANGHAVHPELAEATERYDVKFSSRHRSASTLYTVSSIPVKVKILPKSERWGRVAMKALPSTVFEVLEV